MNDNLVKFLTEKSYLDEANIQTISIDKINNLSNERRVAYIDLLSNKTSDIDTKIEYLNSVISSLSEFSKKSFDGINMIVTVEKMKAISTLGKSGEEYLEVDWMEIVNMDDFSYSDIHRGLVFK